MAHRGGALHPQNLGLENTLWAFRQAAGLGYHYLETDVHATRDDIVMAFHDDQLDRVTDRVGAVAELSYAELVAARIGEKHHIPTLAELLDALPEHRFNIDIKADNAVVPLVQVIEQAEAWDRVLIGSFSLPRLNRFRRLTHGRVPTAAAPLEVALFRLIPSGRLANFLTRGRVQALQMPIKKGRLTLVTPGLVRRAHAAGKQVHVWTVDDAPTMRAMLALGVDGLISDRTDVLQQVLSEHGISGAAS